MDQLRTSHIKVGKGDIESDKDFLEYMKILIEDNISDGYPPVTMAEVDRLIRMIVTKEELLNSFDDFNNENKVVEPFSKKYYKIKDWLIKLTEKNV